MTKIPYTKDGKHRLVFTEDAQANHVFYLRSAVEGRLMWEALKRLESDSSLVSRLDSKVHEEGDYWRGLFFSDYDISQDTESIFTDVSIPIIGRIKPDSGQLLDGTKVATSAKRRCVEGSDLTKPYDKILMFDGRKMWNSDSQNAYLHIDDETLIGRAKDRVVVSKELAGLSYKSISLFPKVADLIREPSRIKALKDTSLLYVLNALGEAEESSNFGTNMCDWQGHYFSDREQTDTISAIASRKLRLELKDSAIAVLREYLSEMK